MKLKVLTANEVLVDQDVEKVTAEGTDGGFTLLPRHVDFVSSLVPGLFCFTTQDGREECIAVDTGILVKVGDRLLVSVRHALRGPGLGELEVTIEKTFKNLGEQGKKARSALARLEADFVQQFVAISDNA